MWTCESIRPGLNKAGSIISGLELAAIINTPVVYETPSK
jgi:hypothetical protein